MKTKRIISILLMLALTASFGITAAFAEGEEASLDVEKQID